MAMDTSIKTPQCEREKSSLRAPGANQPTIHRGGRLARLARPEAGEARDRAITEFLLVVSTKPTERR